MPTTFTRISGLTGMLGAALLAFTFALGSSSSATTATFVLALPLLATTLVGIGRRARGHFGALGSASIALIVIGFIGTAALRGAGIPVIALGVLSFGVVAVRSGAVPAGATALFAVGGTTALVVGFVGTENTIVNALPIAVFLAGWVWMCQSLWSEQVGQPVAA